MDDLLLREAQELMEYTRLLRRDFHRHPELGFQEVRTAGIVARELKQLGIEVTTGIAGTGVMAMVEGSSPGPVVLVRFDMDALPVHEENETEYVSLEPGKMHACGHDGHVAIGITAARILQAHRAELKGTIKFVFQPAEEGLGGAEQMIAGQVLENPVPDYSLCLHLWNERSLGWIGLVPGPMMAGAERFRIRLTGRGGHGAAPHQAVDPVLAGAQLVVALQSIVARDVSPLQSAVVSVTQFHAGDAYNVIPQTVELGGTIRTFEPAVRQRVLQRFEQIVRGTAAAMGCEATFDVQRLTPAVINDAAITQRVTEAIRSTLPDMRIEDVYRTMISEDMAFFMEKVPGCYFLIGSANAARGLDYGHHHPKFDFDEDVLPQAVAAMTASVLALLK